MTVWLHLKGESNENFESRFFRKQLILVKIEPYATHIFDTFTVFLMGSALQASLILCFNVPLQVGCVLELKKKWLPAAKSELQAENVLNNTGEYQLSVLNVSPEFLHIIHTYSI